MGLGLFHWLAHNKVFGSVKIGMDRVRYCSLPCSQQRHPAPCELHACIHRGRGSEHQGRNLEFITQLSMAGYVVWWGCPFVSLKMMSCICAFRLLFGFISQSKWKVEKKERKADGTKHWEMEGKKEKGISKVAGGKKEHPGLSFHLLKVLLRILRSQSTALLFEAHAWAPRDYGELSAAAPSFHHGVCRVRATTWLWAWSECSGSADSGGIMLKQD